MTDHRRAALDQRLIELRKTDGWQPFQHFVLGLLHHEGYTDLRYSAPRSDYGRDAVAVTPDGKRCVVAVSFECTKKKVLDDATRYLEDPNREHAEILLFITSESPAETTWTTWKPAVAKLGLELRLFARPTILQAATRDRVWRDTAARLGIEPDRPGYRLITPYDGEQVRAALQARPAEWLSKRVELREWRQLTGDLRNWLILGKPGAGKTTTLFVHLEATRPERVLVVERDLLDGKVEGLLDSASGGAVIVFDDAHAKANELRALISGLLARLDDRDVSERYRNVRLLIAARSQEWAEIQPSLSLTELHDLALDSSSHLVLNALSVEECRELVVSCVEQWQIEADGRLINVAAGRAAERDATPLYVISMLIRARQVGSLKDEHLAHLPPNVLGLWRDYWQRLTPAQQGVLRVVKLFAVTSAPHDIRLFDAATRAFSLTPHEVSSSLVSLEAALWISRDGDVPTSLDVQLEAIPLEPAALECWAGYVHGSSADDFTRAQLHNGTGLYQLRTLVPRARDVRARRSALFAALRDFNAVAEIAGGSDRHVRAVALNNLSVVYSDLAALEMSAEGRVGWLRKAMEAVEETVRIHCGLRVHCDRAGALNNASIRYAELASLERTRESRVEWLLKAVEAVDEAVRIYRELGAEDDLAMSLNNASNRYSTLAELQATRETRGEWLRKAVEAVDEAVRIYGELGAQGDFAMSLNNASNRYSDIAGLEITREGKGVWLRKAVEAGEKAVRIRVDLGLQSKLALSLNNVAIQYANLAELETTQEDRGEWLRKAVEAVEEAVRICRDAGLVDYLTASLNSTCLILCARAEDADNAASALANLHAAREAIREAVELLRVSGNTSHYLGALQYSAMIDLKLTERGEETDLAVLRSTCEAGLDVARTMEEEGAASFFARVLRGQREASFEETVEEG